MNKRVKRIERKLAERKPEMKHRGVSASSTLATGNIVASEVTAIAQNSTTQGREGSQLKIHHIEYAVSVFIAASQVGGVDVYLVTSKDSSITPVVGEFGTVPGSSANRQEYISWKEHITNGPDNNGNIKFQKNFRYPMKAMYRGSASTDCVNNKTFLVIKNSTGNTVNYSYYYRVWFTDI